MISHRNKQTLGLHALLGNRNVVLIALLFLIGLNLASLLSIFNLWAEVRRLTVVGIRGATTADNNTAAAILSASEELVREMLRANALSPADVAEAIFTTTPDLTAAFAATAARTRVGIVGVPLLGATESVVDGAPPRCIRVLLRARSSVRQVHRPPPRPAALPSALPRLAPRRCHALPAAPPSP
jgi:chorismate mutase